MKQARGPMSNIHAVSHPEPMASNEKVQRERAEHLVQLDCYPVLLYTLRHNIQASHNNVSVLL
jgi:hypothetical protein